MELQTTYKETEVGIIPSDWDVKKIAEVGDVRGGKRLPKGYSLTEHPTPHPYVRVADMYQGGVSTEDIRYVPEGAFSLIQNYRILSSDVFISVAGTLGLVGKVPSELDGANLTENADRITNLDCDQDFLIAQLRSDRVQEQIDSVRTVGAQPKLALSRIREFLIPLPPRPEQRAIADALSDVDALIERLDALIAKKRAIKTAAMQRLLTSQQRLPGFSTPWTTKRLGEIGDFAKGKGIPKKDTVESGIPCVRYAELYTHHRDIIRDFVSFIPESVAESARQLKKGDVLFAGSGETKEEIGMCAAYLSDEEAYAGGDIVILSPKSGDPRFLGYALNAPEAVEQKSSMAQGDAIVHLYARHLSELKISLPPEAEQRAIATILSDMDAEIEALQARRDKTQAIKQGMMQELLTGRTRLV